MTEKEEKYGLALAALIKDIGRFKHQAFPSDEEVDLKNISLEFFNSFIANKTSVKSISNFVSKLLINGTEILFEADQLAAKAEKIIKKEKVVLKPLTSIFSKIDFMDEKKTLPKEQFYTPKKLAYDDVFPKESVENLQTETKKLYDEFVNELKTLPDNEISAYIDSLVYLMEKYLVYVSLGEESGASDISLYDNSKTVAALALCKKYCDSNEKPFLIVAADVSGIQNFIYEEIGPKPKSESRAKRLRGKSFYLSLLTDLFSDYLLKKLDLPSTNILMNGGGHFVMIAPNSSVNKEIIKKAVIEIQKWFYSNFKGNLNLILDTLEADNDLYKDFPKWYNNISSLLVKAKKQKSFDNLEDVFGYDLDRMDIGEYEKNLKDSELDEIKKEDTEYEKNMARLALLFERIGKELLNSNFLVQINGNYNTINEFQQKSEGLIIPFPKFETAYFFANDEDELYSFLNKNLSMNFNSISLLTINGNNEKLSKIDSLINKCSYPVSLGSRFLGNNAPKGKYGPLTFEDLSRNNAEDENNNQVLSYELAATLRMDVDNLGAIFSQGLERGGDTESVRTLSRTVALSREFNLFFGGYLNKIAERWKIYITYSGGDDLFVVGSWINILGFAQQVKADFTKFACNNPYVTISGGIFLHKSSFPIGRAAQFAGEAEDKAKKKSLEKNCISVFDRVFQWDNFNKYLNYGKELNELVVKDEIKSSLLHFLLQISNRMIDDEGSINLNEYHNLISKIKYLLARKPREITYSKIMELEKGGLQVSAKVKQLSKLINGVDSQSYLENLIIPASYVILKNRDINKSNKKQEN